MAITESGNDALRESTDPTIDSLAKLRDQLAHAGEELERITDAGRLKDFIKGIPPMAFQVARETKALVGNLEGVDEGAADDFR